MATGVGTMNDYSRLEGQFKRLPNEFRLILACLEAGVSDDETDHCNRWIDRGIDWDLFIDFAIHHGVYPIVYGVLKKPNIQGIPEPIFTKLQLLYKKNSLDMMNLTAELSKLGTLFNQNGIRMMALKGPALSAKLYGTTSMRPSTDLDLLISGDDIEAAEQLLFKEGYDSIGRKRILLLKEHAFFKRFNHHYVYGNENSDIPIEVHWRLSKQATGFVTEDHFDELWRKREAITFEGFRVSTLSAIDTCLYLIVHGAYHRWLCLRWLYDVAQLLHTDPELTTDAVMDYAGKFKLQHVVGQALVLSKILFGTGFSDTLGPAFDFDRAIRLNTMIIPYLPENLDPATMKPFSRTLYRHILYIILLFNGNRDRIRFLLNHLRPTSIDYETVYLPDRLFPLYYVLRPFLLIFRQLK